MKLLQYFIVLLMFLSGIAILDSNANGTFKHNIIMGSFGYLLVVFSAAIFQVLIK